MHWRQRIKYHYNRVPENWKKELWNRFGWEHRCLVTFNDCEAKQSIRATCTCKERGSMVNANWRLATNGIKRGDLLERKLKPVWLLVVTVCNGAFYLLHILLTIGLTTLEKEKLFDTFIIICVFIYFVFQAVDQGRIYALRYELCDGLARSPDLTDKDPQREMWNFFSPIALFASKPISWGKSELLPVAIQMDFKPGMYESTYFLLTKIYTKKNWNLFLQSFYVKYFMY